MNDWQVGLKIVARPQSLALRLERVLGGYQIYFDVAVTTVEWVENTPLTVIPAGASVTLEVAGRMESLGNAQALPASRFHPAEHSSRAVVSFLMYLSPERVVAVEEFRRGQPFKVRMSMEAFTLVVGSSMRTTTMDATFDVNRDDWIQKLRQAQITESILFEVPVPSPESTPELREAVARLKEALSHQQLGHDTDAIGKCRVAVEALGQAGFANRAPSDVIAFIKENARRLTMIERFSVLQTALHLYLSPSHHAGTDPEEFSRADSTFSLALTAAIVSLAPRRGRPSP